MNALCNMTWRNVAAVSLLAACLAGALAQEPQVQKNSGHVSPLQVRLTFLNGETEKGLLTNSVWTNFTYDAFHFYGNSFSGSRLTIWYDTIASVKEINDKDVLVIFKNGDKRRLVREYFSLELTGPGGAKEDINGTKLRSIEFLRPAHQDRLNNAMFPTWRFSPFTGERLPAD